MINSFLNGRILIRYNNIWVKKAKCELGWLELFKRDSFDIVLTDLMMPKLDGMTVLKEVKRLNPDTIVIIITAHGTVENAVEACHLGAADYIAKPFSHEQLTFVIKKATRMKELCSENIYLQTELIDKYRFDNIIGRSTRMEEVLPEQLFTTLFWITT